MSTIIDRIRDLLDDRPIQSDSTGLFIERQDLREIMQAVEPTFGVIDSNGGFSIHTRNPCWCASCQDHRARHETEAIVEKNTALFLELRNKANAAQPAGNEPREITDELRTPQFDGWSGATSPDAGYYRDKYTTHGHAKRHATQEQHRPEVRGI